MKTTSQQNKQNSFSASFRLRALGNSLFAIFILLALAAPWTTSVQASTPQQTVIDYTLDRSAVPQLTYNALTLKIYIGSAQSVTATSDGVPVPVSYNAQTGYALITTSGAKLHVVAQQAAASPQFGTFTKTVLRDDKRWAWSHGFDDNVDFKLHGIPAFDSYGWRATVYLIGNEISDTRNESWIVDKPDIINLVKKGWAIGNHTWSHSTVDAIGGPAAAASDIIRLDTYLRQVVDQAGRPDYRLMSFAAPQFDTKYLPVILSLRNSHTTGLLFDDSGNNFFIRMDTGGVEPNYSRFGPFDYNQEIGRDPRIGDFGTGSSNDLSFRADIATMAGQLDGTHHYWLNTLSHGVDSQYPGTGIFAFLPWLYKTYGPGGDDSVWVAPAEEIYSYKLVYDNVKISASTPLSVSYNSSVWIPMVRR